GIVKRNERTKRLKLLRGKSERGANVVEAIEDGVISCPVLPVWSRPQLEKTFDHRISKSRQSTQDVAWRPSQINRSTAVHRQFIIPTGRRSKSLPSFHFLQLVDPDQ